MFTSNITWKVKNDAAGSIATRVILAFLLATVAGSAWAQAPAVLIDGPATLVGQTNSQALPTTATIHFTGIDEDAASGRPASYRFLFKPALVEGVGYIVSEIMFSAYREDLVAFADAEWSAWQSYPTDPIDRQIVFPDLPERDDQDRLIHYICALQVMDESGAISLRRDYGEQVVNFHVSTTLSPRLYVNANPFGDYVFGGLQGVFSADVVPGQETQFMWTADTDYGADIASSRWGTDLTDPEDPNDPGWAVPPGLDPENWQTPAMSFSSGIHTVTIEVVDEVDLKVRATYVLTVVPIPPPWMQRPLLLVDDVFDRISNAWPSEGGSVPLDQDQYRDAFWEDVLAAAQGGVEGFDPEDDIRDAEDGWPVLAFRDLVNYRTVVWTERYVVAPENLVKSLFRAETLGPELFRRYNWLAAYQELVGNLMIVGSRHQNAFLAELPYTMPHAPDPLDYPSRTIGLDLIDHMSPPSYQICDGGLGSQSRKRGCVGLKGLVLDDDFTSRYMAGIAAFDDTILTESTIDWADLDPGYRDELETYTWGRDEFYDTNISPCDITPEPQDCEGEPCVEPMFRAYSRLDWNRDLHRAEGDENWPIPYFTPEELEGRCGDLALDESGEATLTNGVPIGFFSHKNQATEPSGFADVVWGFDPYRFDHDTMKEAIRWVLGEHFGLSLRP